MTDANGEPWDEKGPKHLHLEDEIFDMHDKYKFTKKNWGRSMEIRLGPNHSIIEIENLARTLANAYGPHPLKLKIILTKPVRITNGIVTFETNK